MNISYEKLNRMNFAVSLLDNFCRIQSVTNVWRKSGQNYYLEEYPYIEDWTMQHKREVARSISSEDHVTCLAINNKQVIGFVSLWKKLIDKRMVLEFMHVDAAFRGRGIGTELFSCAKQIALENGAESIYIGACHVEETIAFYKSAGAEFTDDIIKEVYDEEPMDMQMLYTIR